MRTHKHYYYECPKAWISTIPYDSLLMAIPLWLVYDTPMVVLLDGFLVFGQTPPSHRFFWETLASCCMGGILDFVRSHICFSFLRGFVFVCVSGVIVWTCCFPIDVFVFMGFFL